MKRPTVLLTSCLLVACTVPAGKVPEQATQSPSPSVQAADAAREAPSLEADAGARAKHAEPGREALMSPQPAAPPAMPLPAARVAVGMPMPVPPAASAHRERYQALADNPVRKVSEAPVSTFSIDVDTGSYSNVRRFLNAGTLPPPDAVRVEEMLNYFPYGDPLPHGTHPFSVQTELVASPWNPHTQLLRIAIQGQDLAREALPPANLVFLVDVSGSMESEDKLGLLKASLKLLTDALRAEDRIALVTYASGTQVVLPATPGNEKSRIHNAIDALQAGGGTAGASGIELAYRTAQEGFVAGGINRILLATDGDFNVGLTDFGQLKAMVETRRRSGIALSTLGLGRGNYNEALMEQLADAGDGAYSYLDSLMEGHKVLVNEMSSTLATIARDVKIQLEFNPAQVSEYRLVGYENRQLAREDFNNDKVDAGDIGAGHHVTALYELTPAGTPGRIDPLRYAGDRPARGVGTPGELAYLKLRYKKPGRDDSLLIETPIAAAPAKPLAEAGEDTRFAVAVASFGQLLRGGRHVGAMDWQGVRALAASARGTDRFGYRGEFLRLIDLAAALSPRASASPPDDTAPAARR